jgi:hypothetical protein
VSATAAAGPALTGVQQVILTGPPVTIFSGQKVILQTTVQYDGGSLPNGTERNVTQLITDTTLATYDACVQTIGISESFVVDRVVEVSGLSGAKTFEIRALKDTNTNPSVTPHNLSIVVMVVGV